MVAAKAKKASQPVQKIVKRRTRTLSSSSSSLSSSSSSTPINSSRSVDDAGKPPQQPTPDYQTTLSEGDFVPDYEESRASPSIRNSLDLASLMQDLVQRPSAVASAVITLAETQVGTNQQLDRVVTKLDALKPKSWDGQLQVQLKATLGDIRTELAFLDRGHVESQRNIQALTTALKELAGVTRVTGDMMRASVDTLTSTIKEVFVRDRTAREQPTEGELDVHRMAAISTWTGRNGKRTVSMPWPPTVHLHQISIHLWTSQP